MARTSKKVLARQEMSDVLVPYYRVSTREQKESGAGMNAQHTALTAWAGYAGKTLLKPCVDEGKSGKNMKRDGLNAALTIVREGRAGGIVVSKLDRLSRSLLDFANLMEEASRGGWTIVALDLGLDTSTPSGRMMANILAVFAQFERDVIGQRTKDGLAEKKAMGVILGRPRAMDEATVDLIVATYGVWGSFVKVAELLNDRGIPTAQGGTKWWPSTVRNVVLNYRDAQKDQVAG